MSDNFDTHTPTDFNWLAVNSPHVALQPPQVTVRRLICLGEVPDFFCFTLANPLAEDQ